MQIHPSSSYIMRIPLNESIEIVNLHPGQVLSVNEIEKLLWKARQNYQYLTITMKNNVYITVNYNRDQSISISSNIIEVAVIREMDYVKKHYAFSRLSNYLVRWILKYNT